jgi:hypothetical protein
MTPRDQRDDRVKLNRGSVVPAVIEGRGVVGVRVLGPVRHRGATGQCGHCGKGEHGPLGDHSYRAAHDALALVRVLVSGEDEPRLICAERLWPGEAHDEESDVELTSAGVAQ